MIHIPVAIALIVLVADHQHPPEHGQLHEKFYQKWMVPDLPNTSCCNNRDCYPTEVQYRDGKVFARHRETGRFIEVPPGKIEQNRDSPDGRNHLCANPYGVVYCFIAGAGI